MLYGSVFYLTLVAFFSGILHSSDAKQDDIAVLSPDPVVAYFGPRIIQVMDAEYSLFWDEYLAFCNRTIMHSRPIFTHAVFNVQTNEISLREDPDVSLDMQWRLSSRPDPKSCGMHSFGFFSDADHYEIESFKLKAWASAKYRHILATQLARLPRQSDNDARNIISFRKYFTSEVEGLMNANSPLSTSYFAELIQKTVILYNKHREERVPPPAPIQEPKEVLPAAYLEAKAVPVAEIPELLKDKTAFELVSEIIKANGIMTIKECDCEPTFNRKKNYDPENNVRDYIERLIFETLRKKEWPKDKPIHITDMGSGELKQSATIAAVLLKEGYDVALTLVDTEYKNKADEKQRQLLSDFKKILDTLNSYFEGKIYIENVTQNFRPRSQVDFMLVIDDINRLIDKGPFKNPGMKYYEKLCEIARNRNQDVILIATENSYEQKVVRRNGKAEHVSRHDILVHQNGEIVRIFKAH